MSKITYTNNWGSLKFFLNGKPFTEEVERVFINGTEYRIQWIEKRSTVGDHGHDYEVRYNVPHVAVTVEGQVALAPLRQFDGVSLEGPKE